MIFDIPVKVELTEELVDDYYKADVSYFSLTEKFLKILFLSVYSFFFRYKKSSPLAFIVETQNVTKNNIVNFHLSNLQEQRNALLIINPADPQSGDLCRSRNYISFPKSYFAGAGLISIRNFLILIRRIFNDPSKDILKQFSLALDLTTWEMKFLNLKKQYQHSIHFSANEDTIWSQVSTQVLRTLGVKTINFQHGRAYTHKLYYDQHVAFNKGSKNLIQMIHPGGSRIVISSKFSIIPKLSNNPKGRILVFDQPPYKFLQSSSKNFLWQILLDIKKKYGVEVAIKLHPRSGMLPELLEKEFQIIRTGQLEESLKGARFCVGFYTTALVDAIAAGIPSVCVDIDHNLGVYRQLEFFTDFAIKEKNKLTPTLVSLLEADALMSYWQELVKSFVDDYFEESELLNVF
jgi:hypothetical protein